MLATEEANTMAQLTNTCQQYKADTKLFVSWLATAAKANG